MLTSRPNDGRSAARRRYQLCTAWLARPQPGQRPPAPVPRAAMVRTLRAPFVKPSVRQPGMWRKLVMTGAMGGRTGPANYQPATVTVHAKCGRATEPGQSQSQTAAATEHLADF